MSDGSLVGGWIVDPAVLPAFALAMALIELTPGPNLSYLALLGASRGRRTGLWAVAGITTGLASWLVLTLIGLTRTPLHSVLGLEVLRWGGAAYLLWLAYDALRPGRSDAASDVGAGRPFVRGLLSNLLNPKAAIFYLALLPAFIKSYAGPVALQILFLGGLHILISVIIHSAAVFGAAGAVSRMSPGPARAFRVVLALSLVAATLWLLSVPLSPGPAQ